MIQTDMESNSSWQPFHCPGLPVKTLKQGCYEVRPPWTLAPGQRVEKASEGGTCWRPGKMRSLWRNLVCLALVKEPVQLSDVCMCV